MLRLEEVGRRTRRLIRFRRRGRNGSVRGRYRVVHLRVRDHDGFVGCRSSLLPAVIAPRRQTGQRGQLREPHDQPESYQSRNVGDLLTEQQPRHNQGGQGQRKTQRVSRPKSRRADRPNPPRQQRHDAYHQACCQQHRPRQRPQIGIRQHADEQQHNGAKPEAERHRNQTVAQPTFKLRWYGPVRQGFPCGWSRQHACIGCSRKSCWPQLLRPTWLPVWCFPIRNRHLRDQSAHPPPSCDRSAGAASGIQ